ncbi:MAG: ribonuclease E/G [Alphaproteobacteria bacterium]
MNNQSLILAESSFGFHRYLWYYQEEIKAIQLGFEAQEEHTGQIHWGRVTKVNSTLKGAFVELTGGLSGFLPFQLAKDFMPLNEGQYLIVQVLRDSEQGKELRLTTNITLRGLYWVAFPNRTGLLKLSKKIHAKEDMERIVELAEPWVEHFGLTARTAARSTPDDDLIAEYQWITSIWEQINTKASSLKKPSLLIDFAHPLIRLLLEDVEVAPEAIIFNSAKALNDVAGELEQNFHFPNIDLAVSEGEDLLADFDIQESFWQLLSKKVPLKSGGNIIIEETAAAVMIDVNSGKQKNISPKQLQEINFAACHEIAKQIRLRNLSGQILVDFISTKDKNHQQKVASRLKQIMANDPQSIDILGFSRLGILEMTRRKVGLSLSQKLLMQQEEYQLVYPVQRALVLKEMEAELRRNSAVKFRLYAPEKQIKKIKLIIEEVSPPLIEYIEAEGEIMLETY